MRFGPFSWNLVGFCGQFKPTAGSAPGVRRMAGDGFRPCGRVSGPPWIEARRMDPPASDIRTFGTGPGLSDPNRTRTGRTLTEPERPKKRPFIGRFLADFRSWDLAVSVEDPYRRDSFTLLHGMSPGRLAPPVGQGFPEAGAGMVFCTRFAQRKRWGGYSKGLECRESSSRLAAGSSREKWTWFPSVNPYSGELTTGIPGSSTKPVKTRGAFVTRRSLAAADGGG